MRTGKSLMFTGWKEAQGSPWLAGQVVGYGEVGEIVFHRNAHIRKELSTAAREASALDLLRNPPDMFFQLTLKLRQSIVGAVGGVEVQD